MHLKFALNIYYLLQYHDMAKTDAHRMLWELTSFHWQSVSRVQTNALDTLRTQIHREYSFFVSFTGNIQVLLV